MAGQDVQHDAGGMHVVRQGLGTGGVHRLNAIRQNSTQNLDHLPVAAGLALQLASHTSDRNRQFPILERRTVAQSAGFAGQNGYIMKGIIDGVVPPEGPHMATDDLSVLPAFEAIGIGSDLDRPSYGAGIN